MDILSSHPLFLRDFCCGVQDKWSRIWNLSRRRYSSSVDKLPCVVSPSLSLPNETGTKCRGRAQGGMCFVLFRCSYCSKGFYRMSAPLKQISSCLKVSLRTPGGKRVHLQITNSVIVKAEIQDIFECAAGCFTAAQGFVCWVCSQDIQQPQNCLTECSPVTCTWK